MKEKVAISLAGVDPQRRDWIKQRNGKVGRKIASYMGIAYTENPIPEDLLDPTTFVVPAGALEKGDAEELFGITSEEDFYGTAVDHVGQVDKSMLYPCVSEPPTYHSADLAAMFRKSSLVLPGYTGFSSEELLAAYPDFSSDSYNLRVVSPNASDGDGQFSIETQKQLVGLLDGLPEEEIQRDGLVIVAELNRPETYSVGSFTVGGDVFHFVARQKNHRQETTNAYGGKTEQTHLGGSYITVAREFDELTEGLPDATREIVGKGYDLLHLYKAEVSPLAPRLSVDMVVGRPKKTQDGEALPTSNDIFSGGTDLTGRLGGHCPGLTMSLVEFKKGADVRKVTGEVTLNYDPGKRLDSEENSTVFISDPHLRVTARINSVVRR